jgi:hypothetical protein
MSPCVMGATSSLAKSTSFLSDAIIGLVDICIFAVGSKHLQIAVTVQHEIWDFVFLTNSNLSECELARLLGFGHYTSHDKSRQEDWLCWIIRSMKWNCIFRL